RYIGEFMTVLVTGAAGFIGYHLCEHLLARGEKVVGIDNVNDYYDVRLKEARLARLKEKTGFTLKRTDISRPDDVMAMARQLSGVRRVVHLAAQAGVRYSLEHPFAYVQANLVGHMAILE